MKRRDQLVHRVKRTRARAKRNAPVNAGRAGRKKIDTTPDDVPAWWLAVTEREARALLGREFSWGKLAHALHVVAPHAGPWPHTAVWRYFHRGYTRRDITQALVTLLPHVAPFAYFPDDESTAVEFARMRQRIDACRRLPHLVPFLDAIDRAAGVGGVPSRDAVSRPDEIGSAHRGARIGRAAPARSDASAARRPRTRRRRGSRARS